MAEVVDGSKPEETLRFIVRGMQACYNAEKGVTEEIVDVLSTGDEMCY